MKELRQSRKSKHGGYGPAFRARPIFSVARPEGRALFLKGAQKWQ
jgi:hypothetical protein